MITIVFGKPGAGKTAFLAADASKYLNYSEEMYELHRSCVSQIRALNLDEERFVYPTRPPVYSNFRIAVPCGTRAPLESYYIDGFHMGFENPDVDIMPVLPGARIYLSEAQRYYNSRRSKDLPDWVSRFYEEHRHFGLDITLDVQRPGLIDVNIRELCGCFIEVQCIENIYDENDNIIASRFHLREFSDWKFVDKYLTDGDECYTEKSLVFKGCVFDYYESLAYYSEFVPTSCDFATISHLSGSMDDDTLKLSKIMYSQTPPEGFYGKRKKNDEVRSDTIYVRSPK